MICVMAWADNSQAQLSMIGWSNALNSFLVIKLYIPDFKLNRLLHSHIF